jgi:hypothetical protein
MRRKSLSFSACGGFEKAQGATPSKVRRRPN